jgi:hypothetical protein
MMWEKITAPQNYKFTGWSIIVILSIIFIYTIGSFVYFKNRKARINVIFGSFAFFLGSTYVFFMLVMASKEDSLVIFWDRFVYMSSMCFFTLLYHFGLSLCKIKQGRQMTALRLTYLTAACLELVLIFKPDYFFSGVNILPWGKHAKAGFAHHFFMLWTLAISIAFLVNIYRRFRSTGSTMEKQQFKYIFIAFFIIWFAAGGYLAAYGIPASGPLAFLPPTIFISIVAFTIIRYRLMEIETVIHKTIMWVATSVMVFIPMAALLVLLWPWLMSLPLPASSAIIIFSFFILLWYYRRLQPRIDHFFQRRRFDPNEVLFRVVSRVSAEEEMEGALGALMQQLQNYLYSKNISVFMHDEKMNQYMLEGEAGHEMK